MEPVLVGRSVLITGGGSGIGLACARRVVADGGSVTICGRTEARLDAAAVELRSVAGGVVRAGSDAGDRVRTVVADVTDEAAVQRAVEVAAPDGKLHGVVASAGGGGLNRIERTSRQEWDAIVDLVLSGSFLTLKASTEPMIAAASDVEGGSSFVGISSIAGARTHRFMTPYSVAKAGLDMLLRQAADEYGGRGVRANGVRPGLIETDLVGMIVGDDTIRSDYVAQTPLGGVGLPDQVADVVRFLLGPESRWVTGALIPVDGGHHLRRGPDFSPWMG